MDYLKLPLDLSSALEGRMERCSNEESIAQHIMMLIVSHYGEVESKNDYGSIIWNLEYNQVVINNDWEENVKKSLEKTITKYERRLKDIRVQVDLTEVVFGLLVANDRPFHFSTHLYISPISQ